MSLEVNAEALSWDLETLTESLYKVYDVKDSEWMKEDYASILYGDAIQKYISEVDEAVALIEQYCLLFDADIKLVGDMAAALEEEDSNAANQLKISAGLNSISDGGKSL
ncbi:MAG: hypothetical protein IJO70_07015 [Lachnospiraceae bacterium]|nr:hypothetical protein [Lachnospiraceae bacterium]